MNFPEKPKVLNLHQLEERLIALRIPFMQIKELPRNSQLSIKGHIVNVPVEVQPTIDVLPRNMSQSSTITVKLKKRLQYKSSVYYENVRPKKIFEALQWLTTNSTFYKDSGIQINEDWKVDDINNDDCSSEMTNTSLTVESDDSDNFSEVDESEKIAGNMDTLLNEADPNSEFVFVFAPGENQKPLGLFLDKDSEYLSFPTIFCGQRRISNEERHTPVHYSDICKWELRNIDRRCANSVPNLFFKMKKLQLKQITDKVWVAMRRCKSVKKKLTASDALNSETINKLVKLDEGYRIFRTIRNSPPYLESKKKDLFAMIRQIGLPTWFISLSAAETKWNDLLKCLAKLVDNVEYTDDDCEKMSWHEKSKLLKSDPVTCARFFDNRVHEFIYRVLMSSHNPIGTVVDFFYRVEFQQRGSPHIHMLMWIENAPIYGKSPDIEISNFIDKHVSCSKHGSNQLRELISIQTHKHSKTCRKKGKAICRFGYPIPPMKKTCVLTPLDPDLRCQYTDLLQKIKQTLVDMKEGIDISFDTFLKQMETNEDEYINCIKSSIDSPKLFLKRDPSEIRINAYMKSLIEAWQANHDIQFVLDAYACAVYIVSYINKSQKGMSALLDAACKEARKGNMDIQKQIRHIGNQFLNNVEISAQEAVYQTLQMNLSTCSRTVVFVNTSPSEERVFCLKDKDALQKLSPNSTEIEQQNWISRYAKRPKPFNNWCLADFVSQINVKYPNHTHISDDDTVEENETHEETTIMTEPCENFSVELPNGTKYSMRTKSRVLRYVNYNQSTDCENFCREKLMLYLPWRNEQSDLKAQYDTYEAHYNAKKFTIDFKRKQYENNHDVLMTIEKSLNQNQDEVFQGIAANIQHQELDDEALPKRIDEQFIHFDPDRPIHHTVADIGIDLNMPNQSVIYENHQYKLSNEQYLELIRSLNKKQREFFTHVIHCIDTNQEPLHVFLTGGAGVGKSLVIKAIHQTLMRKLCRPAGENPNDIRILLCAPTGKAAYNIGGKTIHTAVHVPANQSLKVTSLDCEQLNTLQVLYQNLCVIIIDEISMVGSRLFTIINERLKQIKGNKSIFGGIHVILVGDLFQLKPVLDCWIFQNTPHEYGPLALNLFQEYFTMHELDEIMRQKDDHVFAQLLNRLREGNQTPDDLKLLNQRVIQNQSQCPAEAPRLFPCNYQVDTYNDNIYHNAKTQKAIIHGLDSITNEVHMKTKEWLLESLKDMKKFNISLTGGLIQTLALAVNHQYDITVNVDTDDGITNGATCFIKNIDHRQPNTSTTQKRPSIIWVKFLDPLIGQMTRQKYKNLYTEAIDATWTPVFDVKRSFSYRPQRRKTISVVRIQFPLRPSAAKTIHKAQGVTLEKTVVDMCSKRIPSQMHYVALSRVTHINGLYILNLEENRISQDTNVKQEMMRLRSEKQLQLCYTPLYKLQNNDLKIIFQNARSLRLHFPDIMNDCNILAADIIGLAETRLSHQDTDKDFELLGYKLLRNDQKHTEMTRPYHGLAAYIRKEITIKATKQISSDSLECIFLHIENQCQDLQLVTVYKSPTTTTKSFCSQMREKVIPLLNTSLPIIILGDFNTDLSTNQPAAFLKLFANIDCTQCIKDITTDHDTLLDHIFSNKAIHSGVIETAWSDHTAIWAAIQ